ncbi:hypothetical protein [Granulosicoccus antarcticus]|uniref:FAD:protein FMN transferase n=1 Tax=Granulosicoccus antarcticus IMCC3135 TaxID=1192854 RepID=A0A2Z2NTG9_9GAMM|nr:hypothetical protein [Granulosicoccus antarcticus]ASJ74563.1 hypothetical protein IMCC3135_22465 [Granulosicoccus antarcticus IMCC3135]
MWNKLTLLTSLVSASLVLLINSACSEPSNSIQVRLHNKGQTHQLDASSRTILQTIAQIETSLISADSVLRLAVDKHFINRIINEQSALEILYPTIREFETAFNGKWLTLDRILVPLNGEFADNVTTIFHGTRNYTSGPLSHQRPLPLSVTEGLLL